MVAVEVPGPHLWFQIMISLGQVEEDLLSWRICQHLRAEGGHGIWFVVLWEGKETVAENAVDLAMAATPAGRPLVFGMGEVLEEGLSGWLVQHQYFVDSDLVALGTELAVGEEVHPCLFLV